MRRCSTYTRRSILMAPAEVERRGAAKRIRGSDRPGYEPRDLGFRARNLKTSQNFQRRPQNCPKFEEKGPNVVRSLAGRDGMWGEQRWRRVPAKQGEERNQRVGGGKRR